jgi:hypothetical protein
MAWVCSIKCERADASACDFVCCCVSWTCVTSIVSSAASAASLASASAMSSSSFCCPSVSAGGPSGASSDCGLSDGDAAFVSSTIDVSSASAHASQWFAQSCWLTRRCTLSFSLVVLDLLVFGVDHFIRNSSGRVECVFTCKGIHDATMCTSENACVNELIDGVVNLV